MSVVSDTFTRANETPLASPWTSSIGGAFTAGVTLVSNTAAGVGAVNGLSQYSSNTWSLDQFCEAIVGALAAGTAFAGVCVRLNTTASGYILQTDGTTTTLVRYDIGVSTNLVTGIGAVANGDKLAIRVVGPNISCFKNGVLVASATDTNLKLGNPGILAAGASTLDNFFANDLGQQVQAVPGGIRTGRGGRILRRLRVPIQNWPQLDVVVVVFDPAFMYAMDRPWRDIVFSSPQVVAAGMTPPHNLPT